MTTEQEIKCLETREQKHKSYRYNDMYVEREVIFSEVFKILTATAFRVFWIFLTKRSMEPIQGKAGKRGGKRRYIIANQNKIQFTYKEANNYGISRAAFRDAIDLLVSMGLIDIAHQGSGLEGDVTLYGISNRWRFYGTPDFVVKTRRKRRQHYGFTKGNKHGRGSKNAQKRQRDLQKAL